MNWINKLFFWRKPEFVPHYKTLPTIESVLNSRQREVATAFYLRNKSHVDRLILSTNKAYEPSQVEDKNNPAIWKAEYWKWFLTTIQQ